MGGLGNQLFQIFTLIAYSINNSKQFILPKNLPEWDQRHTYWNSIFINLQKYILNINSLKFIEYNEPNFNYNQIPLSDNNLVLNGYFQSYKYFDNLSEQIFNLIGIKELLNLTKDKYNYYFSNYTVSIHFRLGDYLNKQDCHNILDYEYYEKSIELVIDHINNDNFTILYFCEENDLDKIIPIINNLKKKFINLQFIQIDFDIVDWEQMFLMSLCDNNIIANSTFSWWGAYFGYKFNPNKIVCYPSKWFGPKLSNYNVSDLFLNNWNKI